MPCVSRIISGYLMDPGSQRARRVGNRTAGYGPATVESARACDERAATVRVERNRASRSIRVRRRNRRGTIASLIDSHRRRRTNNRCRSGCSRHGYCQQKLADASTVSGVTTVSSRNVVSPSSKRSWSICHLAGSGASCTCGQCASSRGCKTT